MKTLSRIIALSFVFPVAAAADASPTVDLVKFSEVTLQNIGGTLTKKIEKRGGHQLILKLDRPITFKGCDSSAKGESLKELVVDFKGAPMNKRFSADYLFSCYDRYNLLSIDLIKVRP